MPKMLPDPILDEPVNYVSDIDAANHRLDEVCQAAEDAMSCHPELAHLASPDVRGEFNEGPGAAPWHAKVMLDAIGAKGVRGDMTPAARRRVVRALLLALGEAGYEIVSREQRQRERTEANCIAAMLASGWYSLGATDAGYQPVLRQPARVPQQDEAEPAAAPPTMIAAANNWTYAYDEPSDDGEGHEPNVEAMLAMMGNLPPLRRPGH